MTDPVEQAELEALPERDAQLLRLQQQQELRERTLQREKAQPKAIPELFTFLMSNAKSTKKGRLDRDCPVPRVQTHPAFHAKHPRSGGGALSCRRRS